jgi:TolA-binding protein
MVNGNPFSKGVSLGHIIATVGIVIAGFTFIYDLREAIAILQYKGDTVEQRLERIQQRTDNQFDQIMDHLERLESKIDEMIIERNE